MILHSLFIIKLYLDSASTIVTISSHLEEKSNSENSSKATLKGPYNQGHIKSQDSNATATAGCY